eukprot:6343585-Prymnesium_polylepis.1
MGGLLLGVATPLPPALPLMGGLLLGGAAGDGCHHKAPAQRQGCRERYEGCREKSRGQRQAT